MITASGRWIVPDGKLIYAHGKRLGPFMQSPSPNDIAAAMCRMTRFAGAIWCPLSAHSLLVAYLCELFGGSPKDWAKGLLHDAHETVTGEIVNDYKETMLREMQNELDTAIYAAMDIDELRHDDLKKADMAALDIEAQVLGLRGWYRYKQALGVPVPALSRKVRAAATKYARWLHDDSPWSGPAQIYVGSQGERLLTKILNYVKRGWYAKARKLAEIKPRAELIY